MHYNDDISYLFVDGGEELKFKAKNDQILKEKLCLGNSNSNRATNNSAKNGLHGNVYDFVVGYEPINGVGPIYDMHRYLMKKYGII